MPYIARVLLVLALCAPSLASAASATSADPSFLRVDVGTGIGFVHPKSSASGGGPGATGIGFRLSVDREIARKLSTGIYGATYGIGLGVASSELWWLLATLTWRPASEGWIRPRLGIGLGGGGFETTVIGSATKESGFVALLRPGVDFWFGRHFGIALDGGVGIAMSRLAGDLLLSLAFRF